MTGTDSSSRRSSQDVRSFAGSQISLSELPGPKRSLFSRGRRLRRQSSQLSSASVLDEIEEVDTGKRTSVLRKDRYKREGYGSQGSIPELKQRISSPFDFQHLTHTHRQQFPALDRTTQNELVAEFWAVRASQVPRRELHGIKAEDLHFQNFSSEAVDSTNHGERSRSVLARTPPPLSPQRSCDLTLQESPSPGSSIRGLRHSRSVESFSQPVVKARSHRLSHSVNPPPRVSSRMALTRIDDSKGEESANAGLGSSRGRHTRASGPWDRSTPSSRPSTAGSISTVTNDPDFIAQAVTTTDDIALPALSPGFSTELENVPEEPERFFNPRPAPRPPIRSPPLDSSFRRSPRSPPAMRSASRTSSYGTTRPFGQRSPKPRPLSQMSDTLGSPTQPHPARGSIRYSPSSKRQSSYWKNFDSSWEDDIDYCYEHAAEADCDFDWDRGSIGCDRESITTQEQNEDNQSIRSPECKDESVEDEDDATLQTRFFPGAFRPSLLVPSANSIPELDHRSALSASTTDAGALTPSDIFTSAPIDVAAATSFIDPEGFSLTPSLLVPQDFKYQVMREEMYEDLLADYESSDRHYPLMDAAQSIASSSRSSGTRLSKRSSYDSSLISGPGSISSPARRSASSSGSLPELVHSRRVRKTFDMMIDQLTEQVPSFSHLDEDDEEEAEDTADETASLPTTNSKGTFFAAEDDDSKQDAEAKSDTEEVEHELEYASSTTPTSATQHERAASDGAAKMLETAARPAQTPPKTRTRAASSSNTYRASKQAYTLSLFPTPPKPRKVTQ
ncbi:hypothetical protein AOQ84DRAFT_223007 [Glonium stellatum]|uniref:CRIB domain-containing protein n=1 Tax=Glonium stellatum TaxID=574774 RepID=A0A8E2EYM5_9PEZI|nr:hypothetical protein AOQ84DRAFT_223007 [Glonium stellatum]